MNEIRIFENTEFGKLNVIYENEKAYFPATECARMLGYTNPYKAVGDHCRAPLTKREGVCITKNQYGVETKQHIEMNFISEGDLYRLITHSKLERARAFESWVFDEVLPTIRKHGAYATDATIDRMIEDPDFGIKLLGQLKQEREERRKLEEKVQQDAPKVFFASSVECSGSEILVGEMAKLLKQNGVSVGQNRFFEMLRKDGFLISRNGADRNMPTQKSMEMGLMRIKESSITHADGHVTVTKTPKITGKGQVYFMNRYAESKQESMV